MSDARNDASRLDPAPAFETSRSSPNAVDTNTLATPAPSPVSGEPECAAQLDALSRMLDQAERFGANHPYSPHLDRDWWRQLPIAREAQAALASLLSDRERLTRELEEMRADAERWRAIKNLVRQNAKRAGLGGGVILCSMDANEHDAAWASIQAIDHENPRNTLWMSEAESLDVAVDAARASLLQSEDD